MAHLVDKGEYMYHIKIWVHIWPGAFIICPGSSLMAQVYVHVWLSVCECVCAFHLSLCFRRYEIFLCKVVSF